jgi:hypothetical protein
MNAADTVLAHALVEHARDWRVCMGSSPFMLKTTCDAFMNDVYDLTMFLNAHTAASILDESDTNILVHVHEGTPFIGPTQLDAYDWAQEEDLEILSTVHGWTLVRADDDADALPCHCAQLDDVVSLVEHLRTVGSGDKTILFNLRDGGNLHIGARNTDAHATWHRVSVVEDHGGVKNAFKAW